MTRWEGGDEFKPEGVRAPSYKYLVYLYTYTSIVLNNIVNYRT